MILCNFVRNDEIIGNTTAISYETKKSGAWRSSCHMPDFFCLVPIFINFLLKYSSHISTHMEIFSHLPARHTLSNKFQLKYSSEPDSPLPCDRQLLPRLGINAVKPTGKAGNHKPVRQEDSHAILADPQNDFFESLRKPGFQTAEPEETEA